MNRSRCAAALLTLCTPLPAVAATFCVDTSAELQQALTIAASNGESDFIRVAAGLYESTSSVAFSYLTGQDFSLRVVGGYLSNCAVQVPDPSLTVISGSNLRPVLSIRGFSGSSGTQTLQNLTIADGASDDSGAGLTIGGFGGFAGEVNVVRVVFSRNVSQVAGGGMSVATAGEVEVLNNLFLLNRCALSGCGFTATVNATSPAMPRAFFGNNTLVRNGCVLGSSCIGSGARYGGSASSVFYNNLFTAQTAGDLTLQNFAGGGTALYNNNLVSLDGSAPTQSVGNLAFANPQFADFLNDDYRPALGSPMRNAGTSAYLLQALDLLGAPRVNDGIVDIGAYENDEIQFKDGFEPPLPAAAD